MPQSQATIAKPIRTTSSRSARLPAYRERAPYGQAIVTLTDAKTKQRKDFWLGEFGSSESREAYNRVIAQWLNGGRLLTSVTGATAAEVTGSDISVNALALAYWQHAQTYYDARMQGHLRAMIRLIRQYYGTTPAVEFGPKSLRLVRDAMISGDPDANPPRKPWSRKYINSQIQRLCQMFRWGVSHEMIPGGIYEPLKAVPALRQGKTAAHDYEAVRPVPQEQIDAIRPFLSRQVEALVDLQLLTGARSGEVMKLRPMDIETDRGDGVWVVTITHHKNAHRGHARILHLGPRAQAVLTPFLAGRSPTTYLFSPKEADAERQAKRAANRRTPPQWGNAPGTHRVETRRKLPGDHFRVNSYRQSIARACRRAFPVPAGLSVEQQREWRRDHQWHPHALRHNAGSALRREYGLEVARAVLGHRSVAVTQIYAENDLEKVVEAMKRLG